MEYNLENYKKAIAEVEKEKDIKINNLVRIYAQENNTIKIGDIVKDHMESIIVEKINFVRPYYNELPHCVYYGTRLKKDGTPRKDMTKTSVHQSNLE